MVPRAVKHLFDGIDDRMKTSTEQGIPSPQFDVTVEFIEVYNEEIKDLFNPSRDPTVISNLLIYNELFYAYMKRVKIYESPDGKIYIDGAVQLKVDSEQEVMTQTIDKSCACECFS